MRIAVNTRLLLPKKLEGIGWFTHETLKRLTTAHPEHEFIFLFDRPFSDEFIYSSNITPVVTGPQSRHPLLWYAWFEWSVPHALKKYKADLFLSQDGYLSLNTQIPQVDVIHDLNFEHYPKDLPFTYRSYYRHFFPRYAQRAKRIATVSEFSKKDLILKYSVDPDIIDVVYNGVNESFKPVTAVEKENTKRKYTNGEDYFLFIGALHPRKNIVRMINAFSFFKQRTQAVTKLVLAGNKKWWTGKMEEAYQASAYKEDIILTGRVSNEDLYLLMGAASALLYVPYFEGFGIPIIEAMRCGTPVITANITSMPEVAGGAAVCVNPFSEQSIALGMQTIYSDKVLTEQLILKGFQRASDFTWDKTANALWNTIEKAVP